MTKDIVIQVFLDLKQYEDIKEAANTRKIVYKTTSDLIRKLLFDYTEKVSNMVATSVLVEQKVGALHEQSAQKEAIIEALRHQNSDLHNENEILKGNLDIKIKEAKHDKK